MNIDIYLGIADLPHFNPDLDNDNAPASLKELRRLIENADGVLISTPEYVFSLPGALKNVLEWTVSTPVFSDKPTAFISAGTSGEIAFESLDLILRTIGAKVDEGSKLIIKADRGKLNSVGEISDQTTIRETDALMSSFLKTMAN